MARNGSGTYSLPAGQPVVTGTQISSSTFNTLTSDIATALTYSLAKDGQTTPTANLPMGGYKFTGIGDGSIATDSVSLGQVADGLNGSGTSLEFTQTGTGAVARTWKSKVGEFVSVKDFGAVGDGTTDDTTAIQAAIDTGNPVYIPPGTYKITSSISMSTVASIGQRVRGAGAAREDTGTGTNVTIIKPSSAVSVAFSVVAAGGISVRGFELSDFSIDMTDMTDASTRIGIKQNDAWSARIQNITFLNQGTNKRCFKFEEGAYLTQIENCRGTLVELAGVSAGDAVTTLMFQNCDFDKYIMNYAASISVWGGAVQGTLDKFALSNTEGLFIFGCDIEGSGTYLAMGSGVTNVCTIGNHFGGFSGTYTTGTVASGKSIFLDSYDIQAQSNALTYKQQSFTPTISFGGASVGVTYFNQGATSTRIGDRVFVTLDLIINDNGSSTGAAAIGTLPWAGNSSVNQDFAINVNNGTLTGQLFGRIAPSATTITLFVTNNGSTAAATEANITNSATMRASFSYQA